MSTIARDKFSRYLVCLGIALAFALLPAGLVHYSGNSSCDTLLQTQDRSHRGVTANPFSHYNLCKIRLRLSRLTIDVYQHPVRTIDSQSPAPPSPPPPTPNKPSGTSAATTVAAGAGAAADAGRDDADATAGGEDIADAVGAGDDNADGGGDGGNDQDGDGAGAAGTDASDDPLFSSYRIEDLISTTVSVDDMQEGGVEDWTDFELPKTQEDLDRIMQLPHVDECNFCEVCVPTSALKLQRGGARKAGAGARQLVEAFEAAEAAFLATVAAAGGGGGSSGSGAQWADASAAASGGLIHGVEARPLGTGGSFRQLLAAAGGAKVSAPRKAAADKGAKGKGKGEGKGKDQGADEDQDEDGDKGKRDKGKKKDAAYSALDATESDGVFRIGDKEFDIADIAPGDRIFSKKQDFKNCTVCRGCDHTLEMMASGSVLLGSYYAHEPGGSPSWLFRVRTKKTASGWAVVKVWCVPVLKAKQRGLAMCSPKRVFAQVKLLLAQQKLTAECGLNTIVPKVWVEPVNGVIPGNGFHVNWLGLWADIADGVSVQNIQEFGKPPLRPEVMLDLLRDKVYHEEIKMGAIFDLLFSQCDRHQQNVFLTGEGKVWLIDNDQVFSTAWRKCGIDSMIVPTTQKFMINHLGFFYVLKYPQKDPPKNPHWQVNPLLMLDYRCHVKGGEIGKAFTPQLVSCMKHVRSKDPETILREYGYPTVRMAEAVRNRSRDLLEHGYEWTLKWGEPTNQPMHRYKVAPPCCDVAFNRSNHKYYCATKGWTWMREIPYGNSWHGGAWHGTEGKDTGTYEGGTVF